MLSIHLIEKLEDVHLLEGLAKMANGSSLSLESTMETTEKSLFSMIFDSSRVSSIVDARLQIIIIIHQSMII